MKEREKKKKKEENMVNEITVEKRNTETGEYCRAAGNRGVSLFLWLSEDKPI